MGKPEDFGEDTEEEEPQKTTGQTGAQQGATIRRRLYRNPDDKILGGVISGLAAYLNWDVDGAPAYHVCGTYLRIWRVDSYLYYLLVSYSRSSYGSREAEHAGRGYHYREHWQDGDRWL